MNVHDAIDTPCASCGSPETDFGAHGVRNGQVFSEHYCAACWNKSDRPHPKTWSCINPCGDGCDGNHLPQEAAE